LIKTGANRAYGQRDPLNEYKSEAFTLFDGLLTSLREDVTKNMLGALLDVQYRRQQQAQQQNQNQTQQQLEQARAGLANMQTQAARPARSPLDMVNQGAPAAPEDKADLPEVAFMPQFLINFLFCGIFSRLPICASFSCAGAPNCTISFRRS